jgi:hypothetical protein
VLAFLIAALAGLAALPSAAGAATASWAFEPASVDFGVLMPGEAAAPAHLKLVNTGEVAVTPAFVALNPSGDFRLGSNTCGSSLAPGGSCQFEVKFTPQSPGTKEATLEVAEANGTVPPAVAKLTGAGVSPTATVDPTTIDFGTVQAGIGSERERTATITNQGPGELFFANAEFFIGGAPASHGPLTWSGTTCKARSFLPPGGSCAFTFRLAPLDLASAAGELRITDNALDSPQVIHVSGTAVAPPAPPTAPPPPSPATTLTGHPSQRAKSRVATFTFTGNQDTTSFECRLDKSAFRRCTSPVRYRPLQPGKHHFWVRPIGTSPSTVLGPAVTYSWRVIARPKKRAHRRPHR